MWANRCKEHTRNIGMYLHLAIATGITGITCHKSQLNSSQQTIHKYKIKQLEQLSIKVKVSKIIFYYGSQKRHVLSRLAGIFSVK